MKHMRRRCAELVTLRLSDQDSVRGLVKFGMIVPIRIV